MLDALRKRITIDYLSMRVGKSDHSQMLLEIGLDLPRPKKSFKSLASFMPAAKMLRREHLEYAIGQRELA